MNKREILKRVAKIKVLAEDPESAHADEDDLRDKFICEIAKRKDALGKRAKIVLSTNDIDFPRWCA